MIDINILSCVGIDVTKIQSIELEDETINEIMKDVTFQSNNKEEKSQNNIPQKNNQKTSEKGIIAIKRTASEKRIILYVVRLITA